VFAVGDGQHDLELMTQKKIEITDNYLLKWRQFALSGVSLLGVECKENIVISNNPIFVASGVFSFTNLVYWYALKTIALQ
jgi:hypothetical protein